MSFSDLLGLLDTVPSYSLPPHPVGCEEVSECTRRARNLAGDLAHPPEEHRCGGHVEEGTMEAWGQKGLGQVCSNRSGSPRGARLPGHSYPWLARRKPVDWLGGVPVSSGGCRGSGSFQEGHGLG